MAAKKFLSLEGFRYFINKVIGKTDISGIGDGTATGAISELNDALSNISTTIMVMMQKSIQLNYNTFYTEIDCNLQALSPVSISPIVGHTSSIPDCYPIAAYVPSDGTLRVIFNKKATTTDSYSILFISRTDFFIDKNGTIFN